MDFTQGILAANKPIGEFDPIGSMQKSQKNIADITQQNTANEKSRYELDLTYKLQDAINNSLDAEGNPDFKKLAVEGQKRGIAPSVIQYAISALPAQWEALSKTAQAKRSLSVAAPEASTAIQGALGAQPAQVAPAAPEAPPAPTQSWRNRPKGMTQDSQTAVARPVLEEPAAPAPTEAPAPTPDNNIFSVMNKAEVKSPFRAGVAGDGKTNPKAEIQGISDYTLPVAGRTVDGSFVPYTEAELAADPQLNTSVAAENFFRTRTGDNESDANTVAQTYLRSVYDATLASEGAPAEPMPPVDPSPEALDKYNTAYTNWMNENSKAVGKAQAAVNQVKEAVGKGQFELADKLVSNQATKVKVDGEEYRAYSTKAREGVAALESLKPVTEGLKKSLSTVKTEDYYALELLIPQTARVMAMSLNPGSDVSMGSIAEAEATTRLTESGLFSSTDIPKILATWVNQKDESARTQQSLFEIAAKHYASKLKTMSAQNMALKLKELLTHAEEAGDAYKKANLIGYGDEKKGSWRDRPREKKTEKKDEKKTESPVRVRSVKEAMALPVGTKFIDPNGVLRTR